MLNSVNIFLLILLVATPLLISGCTTKAWYSGAKYEAKRKCRNLPPSEIDQCLQNLNSKSFDEYTNKR